MDESEARIETWTRVITYLERNPLDFALVCTMVGLDAPPDSIAFTAEHAGYIAAKAMNTDYLKFGRFEHCGRCYAPVAVLPDRLVEWPLPEHTCGGKPPMQPAGAVRTDQGRGRASPVPPPSRQPRPLEKPRPIGLDF